MFNKDKHSTDFINTDFDNLIEAIEQSRFTCEKCDGWFGDTQSFEEHMKIHKADDVQYKFKCFICNKSFKYEHFLQRHSNKHISLKKYDCNNCRITFKDLELLNIHKKKCQNSNNKDFLLMGNMLTDKSSDIYHPNKQGFIALNGERNKDLQLGVDIKIEDETDFQEIPNFIGNEVLGDDEIHFQHDESAEIYNEANIVDVINNYEFSEDGDINDDYDTSDLIQIFACQFCGKTFSQASHLRAHVVWHTGSRLYKCLLCDFSFNRLDHLKRHINTHRGLQPVKDLPTDEDLEQTEMYLCPMCSKEFRKEEHMFRHMHNIHESEPQFVCNKCGRKFKDEIKLKKHVVWHGKYSGRGFKCPICPSCFRYPSFLMYHMRVHSNERPFPCKSCSKTFKQQSHLKRHMELHQRDHTFYCEFCGHSFGSDKLLQSHVTFKCAFRVNDFQEDCDYSYRGINKRKKIKLNINDENEIIDERQNSSQQLVPNVALEHVFIATT